MINKLELQSMASNLEKEAGLFGVSKIGITSGLSAIKGGMRRNGVKLRYGTRKPRAMIGGAMSSKPAKNVMGSGALLGTTLIGGKAVSKYGGPKMKPLQNMGRW